MCVLVFALSVDRVSAPRVFLAANQYTEFQGLELSVPVQKSFQDFNLASLSLA